ncbi:hypothetical protein LWM68_01215 [Niabella sp. W65]|nr:hypothetical protein [Niabella sp. W65]MCH7361523.1 hypothetical protein [Niabella sp. W65]
MYRQTDPVFLTMLNAIRDNDIENINFDLLHKRYQPDFEPEEFCVHLVSHNYMADAINKQKLNNLEGKAIFIKLKYGESLNPIFFLMKKHLS